MHRKDMIDVFLRNLPFTCTIHTSKRLLSYTEDESSTAIVLTFADGTTAEADVLIGADGIHSAVRARMYEVAHAKECLGAGAEGAESSPDWRTCSRCKAAAPVWSGLHAYRCLISTEKLYALNPDHTTASIGTILCVCSPEDRDRSPDSLTLHHLLCEVLR